MNQKLFVFWRYDKFPYFIGAKVKSFGKGGSVIPEGYQGMQVLPAKIMLYPEGLKRWKELLSLKEEYEKEKEEIKIKYTDMIKDLMPCQLPIVQNCGLALSGEAEEL